MKLVERICFPTDFGKSSEDALESVINIAKKFGSDVSLVHVFPDSNVQHKVQRFAEEKIAKYVDLLEENGIKCTADFISGKHIDALVSFAVKKKSNLIVLGAGHVGKKKYKLGSNSEKIIRNSSIPVWVIEENSAINPEKVLCPIDFSKESMLALGNAIKLCRVFGSKLHILHAVKEIDQEYAELGADIRREQEEIVKEIEVEFNQSIKDLDLNGIHWSKEVRLGDPAQVILDVIKDKNIDLVMMGSTGKGALKRIFIGSIAERVSREVPCSFIINKTEGMIQLKLDKGITDIEAIYNEGVELAKQGFVKEAIVEWQRCINMNEFYIKAWGAIVKGYKNLGDEENAASYNTTRERIQRTIWDKQVEADLRGKHFLFK